MKFSVLIPSRQNPQNLIATIESYKNLSSNDNELEFLVAFDDDDESRFIVEERYSSEKNVLFYEFPRIDYGYWKHHEYHNYMAGKSTGDILCLTSDKSVMITERWDKTLEPFFKKFIVTSPLIHWIEGDGSKTIRGGLLLPIISKKYYDVLGKVSTDCQVDSSIGWTVGQIPKFGPNGIDMTNKILKYIPNVICEHDRRKAPGISKEGESTFYSEEAELRRYESGRKLYFWLNENEDWWK